MLKLAQSEIVGYLDINRKKCLSLQATIMTPTEIKEFFSFVYVLIQNKLKPTLFATLHMLSEVVIA